MLRLQICLLQKNVCCSELHNEIQMNLLKHCFRTMDDGGDLLGESQVVYMAALHMQSCSIVLRGVVLCVPGMMKEK